MRALIHREVCLHESTMYVNMVVMFSYANQI